MNFTIDTIPFGIFTTNNQDPRVCTAIDDQVVDMAALAGLGYFDTLDIDKKVWENEFINDFMALGKATTSRVIAIAREVLNEKSQLQGKGVLHSVSEVQMQLPVRVGDYTDFYSSIEHATNVGKMFRDPENALLPNWKHLPVGYHGRASSIIVSGKDIKRPHGQTKPADGPPVYGPSQRMDFELEMAFVIGKDSELGSSISTKEAEDYIFGLCLFNDWSARDIQKWEYVPLGPFLGKSFASTVSPWVIPLESLEPFRVDGPVQEPKVLSYLEYDGSKNYDVKLEVVLKTAEGVETTISKSNFKYMYWNMCQQLAHHTVNGCNVRVGDMMASGTISGKTPDSYGSMLEISWAGKNPITLADGSQRKFIQDGDEIILKGYCEKDGKKVNFGEAAGKVVS